MPNLRELRSRIKSIESTSRVTKALQMIAAAKMKKAQDKVLDGRSYSEKLNAIIGNVYQSNPEIFYQQIYLFQQKIYHPYCFEKELIGEKLV